MRPFLVLLGFVLGSSVSISFALGATALVFLVLKSDYPRLAGEMEPLLMSLAIFCLLTIIAAISFYAEARGARWRSAAAAGLAVGVLAVGWYYWPD